MIVTELREDNLDLAPIAYLSRRQCRESLDGPGAVCVVMDLPIRGNHSVVSLYENFKTTSE